VFFSERGDTKLDLVRYYLAVEGPVMDAMGDRPVLLQRFPDGATGKSFFQKRIPDSAPDWLQTTTVSTPNGTTSRAIVMADIAHVLWAANQGCLGFHPWPYRASAPEDADELRLVGSFLRRPPPELRVTRLDPGAIRAAIDGIPLAA
jgi:DNA primase